MSKPAELDWPLGLNAACPKCRAAAGEPCVSLKTGGPMTGRYRWSHKRRVTAEIVGALVLAGPPSAKQLRFSRSSSHRGQLPVAAAPVLPVDSAREATTNIPGTHPVI